MASPSCDRCRAPAIHLQRYSGVHACADHLRESVEARARKETRKQWPAPRGARILVAYSGGKDSTVALQLMADLRAARPDLDLLAVTVDEGIQVYRPPSLEITRDVCRDLRVEHVVRRTRDVLGVDIDDVDAGTEGYARCTPCGVARRRIMNDAARDLGATVLVTGHNLDDLAQSVLMNMASANLEGLAKLAPHDERMPGLVPRVLPLRLVPENEVYLYATVRGLRFHDAECPYAGLAQRQVYRDVLHQMEAARPGTRHALVTAADELKPLLKSRPGRPAYRSCPACGEPTSGDTCKVCQFRLRFAPAAPDADLVPKPLAP